MRATWPAHKPMSVRISATDWAEGGITGDDAVAIARAFAEVGVDLVDVSTGQTVRDARPVYGRMFQTLFSDQVRNEARVATMCVGNITTADQVNTILAAGRADLVALARPHLVDPSFTLKAAAWYGADAARPRHRLRTVRAVRYHPRARRRYQYAAACDPRARRPRPVAKARRRRDPHRRALLSQSPWPGSLARIPRHRCRP